MDRSYLAWVLPSRAPYCRKDGEDVEEDIGRYWMTMKKRERMEIEVHSDISFCVENSLWYGSVVMEKTE